MSTSQNKIPETQCKQCVHSIQKDNHFWLSKHPARAYIPNKKKLNINIRSFRRSKSNRIESKPSQNRSQIDHLCSYFFGALKIEQWKKLEKHRKTLSSWQTQLMPYVSRKAR